MIMNRIAKAGSFIAAAAVGLILLLLLHTRGHVIEPVFLRYLMIWIPVLFLLERLQAWQAARVLAPPISGRTWPVIGLMIFLILFLFSSMTDHPWFYFPFWLPKNAVGMDFIESDLGRFVLLTALLTPFFVTPTRWRPAVLLGLLIATQLACGIQFLKSTGGLPLYNDDHASFLFRLWEYSQTGLQLINYNPYWNAGLVESHYTQSGTPALGPLIWLMQFWFQVDQVYSPALLVVFVGIVPFLAVFSLRAMRSSWSAVFIAGLLAVGVSQTYFLWLFNYGTAPACLASTFILPVSACLFRVMLLDRREWWLGVCLVLSGYYLLLWPPGSVMLLALALSFVVNIRMWSWGKIRFLLICAGFVLLLNFRRFIVLLIELGIFGTSSPAATTTAAGGDPLFTLALLKGGWGTLVDYLRLGQPLLIFLGIGGVWVIARSSVRRWFLPIILGLMVLTGWGAWTCSALQLHRIAIPLFFAAIVPASLMASELLQSRNARLALLRAALVAFLAVSGWNTARLFGNEGRARYVTIPPEISAMARWLGTDDADGGRVLFAGCTLHGYCGHVACLPYLAGREMMACDYYHFGLGSVEYNYPPRAWRTSPENIARFMELYNVTTLSTICDEHMAFFRAHPEQYREVRSFGEDGGRPCFKVLRPSAWFLENDGRVSATFNRIRVSLRHGDRPAVIKYNWHPALSVTAPAELYPFAAGPGVTLIGIRPNGLVNLEIHYRSWL